MKAMIGEYTDAASSILWDWADVLTMERVFSSMYTKPIVTITFRSRPTPIVLRTVSDAHWDSLTTGFLGSRGIDK